MYITQEKSLEWLSENGVKEWHLLTHRFLASYFYFNKIAFFYWQRHFITIVAKTTAQQTGNEWFIAFFAWITIGVSFLSLQWYWKQLRLQNVFLWCKITSDLQLKSCLHKKKIYDLKEMVLLLCRVGLSCRLHKVEAKFVQPIRFWTVIL